MTDPTRAWTLAGEHPADRLLRSQDVRRGSLPGEPPPTPLQVAAVLHGLADHTHIVHILHTVAGEAVLASPGDHFNPAATSLGRYFHGLADHIEHQATTQEQP